MEMITARLGNARNKGRAGLHVLNVSRHHEPCELASSPLNSGHGIFYFYDFPGANS